MKKPTTPQAVIALLRKNGLRIASKVSRRGQNYRGTGYVVVRGGFKNIMGESGDRSVFISYSCGSFWSSRNDKEISNAKMQAEKLIRASGLKAKWGHGNEDKAKFIR